MTKNDNLPYESAGCPCCMHCLRKTLTRSMQNIFQRAGETLYCARLAGSDLYPWRQRGVEGVDQQAEEFRLFHGNLFVMDKALEKSGNKQLLYLGVELGQSV